MGTASFGGLSLPRTSLDVKAAAPFTDTRTSMGCKCDAICAGPVRWPVVRGSRSYPPLVCRQPRRPDGICRYIGVTGALSGSPGRSARRLDRAIMGTAGPCSVRWYALFLPLAKSPLRPPLSKGERGDVPVLDVPISPQPSLRKGARNENCIALWAQCAGCQVSLRGLSSVAR
jgi:hypothetical protein